MRDTTQLRCPAIAALLVSLYGSLAFAQTPRLTEPTAADVARSLRTRASPGFARVVLTQALGARERHVMDEIADTLMAVAMTPGTDELIYSVRSEAVSALTEAGVGYTGISDQIYAVPYAGAVSRLVRIAQAAQDMGLRAAALVGLLAQPDRQASLQLVRSFAVSQDPLAEFAVITLGNNAGPDGLAIARELHRSGSVTQPYARSALDGIARYHRWQ
jgi:hypothetical protein